MAEAASGTTHPSGDKRFKLLDRAINLHHGDGHGLIEVLHTAQNVFGFLEDDILIYIAHALKRPLSQVYGVATFYHYFRLKPPGEHTFILCQGTACYVKGAASLLAAVRRSSTLQPGQTDASGRLSFQTARCLGACGIAPAAVLDGTIVGRQTPESVQDFVARCIDGRK